MPTIGDNERITDSESKRKSPKRKSPKRNTRKS